MKHIPLFFRCHGIAFVSLLLPARIYLGLTIFHLIGGWYEFARKLVDHKRDGLWGVLAVETEKGL